MSMWSVSVESDQIVVSSYLRTRPLKYLSNIQMLENGPDSLHTSNYIKLKPNMGIDDVNVHPIQVYMYIANAEHSTAP